MGLKFWEWIRGGKEDTPSHTVEIHLMQEMFEATQEYQIRNACCWICVNMIANAISRCEFRTYRHHEEIFESEYYLWNVEPNVNQNSTEFLHELIAKLCKENEVLVISSQRKTGGESLLVADSWTRPSRYPQKMNEYRGVRVGEVTYEKTFRENEVMRLKLHHQNIQPVLDALTGSFERMHNAAVKAYEWSQGQHWKVHVDSMAQGQPDFLATFAEMIEKQVKPFLTSNGAVLPEFDGYNFQNVGGNSGVKDTRDIRAMTEDIFDFTARGFAIPAVLVNGKVEATGDADKRWMSGCIQPICDQLQEEAVRKRYGYNQWVQGNYLRVDSSNINHFDLFANAGNVEKLIGSGVFTINDILRASGQATIDAPWANEHFMTKNIAKMAEVTQALGTQEGGNK